MPQPKIPYLPSVKQLLNSEAMAEAQVLFGEELLDRAIVQIATSLTPTPRAGSLLVLKSGMLEAADAPVLANLAAIVIVKPYVLSASAPSDHTPSDHTPPGNLPSADSLSNHALVINVPVGEIGGPSKSDVLYVSDLSTQTVVSDAQLESSAAHTHGKSGLSHSPVFDADLTLAIKLGSKAATPVIVLPGVSDAAQAAEDIRQAFLESLRRTVGQLHNDLVNLVLEQGLLGLVEEVSDWVGRPLAIESAEFKVLAAKDMGQTPPGQQRQLADQVSDAIHKQSKLLGSRQKAFFDQPIRIGRRLVMPIILHGAPVGYLSAMVRPNDDLQPICEYLVPAALAARVEFAGRGKDITHPIATYKSLLKDLLSGRGLSAADQERLERHFGFDLWDGFYVFAVQPISGKILSDNLPEWTDKSYVTTEVEGTLIFVVPFSKKSDHSWQQESAALTEYLEKHRQDLKVQLGASRPAETLLDLPDAYLEARQALIIGSMINGDAAFSVSYNDLGVNRLLYLIIDHPELERFYAENLEPLESYDAEWESELVPTLRVYLNEGANLNSAARALYVHRHTLRYRLEQIAEILKVDIDAQQVLLNLQIAFLIKDMKSSQQT